MGAFFIALVLALALSACAEQVYAPSAESLKYVVDGDTIVLGDGRRIRLIGVNAPELGRGDRASQPYAQSAKKSLTQWLNGGPISLQFGPEKHDAHGRDLAHVFAPDGGNVQIQLLEQGLAFAVAVGPNQTKLTPYLAAEAKARKQQRGIWSAAYFAPQSVATVLRNKTRGYRRVMGEITATSQSKRHINLHLGERFKVLIPRQQYRAHFKRKPDHFVTKQVVVSGWLFNLNEGMGLKIYHPAMIE